MLNPLVKPIYWRNYSELKLAAYQQDQGRNPDCAKFTGASALNMLYDLEVQGQDLLTFANGRYAIPFKSGTTMRQLYKLLRGYSQKIGISPKFRFTRNLNQDQLLQHLQNPNQVIVLSVGWLGLNREKPYIYRGWGEKLPWTPKGLLGGHVMALVAYDPRHTSKFGHPTEWGFLSSWVAGGQVIHWMGHENFMKTIGGLRNPNPVMLIERV